MTFVDLVLQGIKKFVQSQKIPFKPGFNLIFGGNDSGKSILFECLLELLFPTRPQSGIKWQSWEGTENCRAGLTFKQGDYLYRILKDFNQNRISLSRKSPEQEKFERLSANPEEVSSILREELNLPDFNDFKNLFAETRNWLPSVRGIKSTTRPAPKQEPAQSFGEFSAPGYPGMSQPGYPYQPMPGITPPGMGAPGYMSGPGMPPYPGMPGVPAMPGMGMPGTELLEDDGLSWEEKEKKLEELRQELERVKEMEEIQFELDGYQGKIFEIEKEKEKVKKIDQEIEKLDKELEKYRFFRSLPENIDQRIAQYDSLQVNRAKEVEALDTKLADLDDELRFLTAQPKIYQKGLFKGAIALLVLGILGFVLKGIIGISALQYVGFLLIPGVVMLFIVLWQFLSEETKKTHIKDEVNQLEEQRRTVIKDYEVKGAIVKRLLEQTKCENTGELKEMLDTYRKLEQRKNQLVKKKKELMIEMDWDQLTAQEKELQAKVKELEEKLKGFAGLGMDPNELRREIERLESSLERARKLGLIPGEAEAGARQEEIETTEAERVLPTTFWDSLLTSASRVLGAGEEEIYQQISSRLNLYLQALSNKRYQEVRKEGDQLLLRHSELEREIPIQELGETTLDWVYLSLKFALWEKLVQFNFPILLDDPFLFLDQKRKSTVAGILKRISDKIQLILFSSDKSFASQANHALSLGE